MTWRDRREPDGHDDASSCAAALDVVARGLRAGLSLSAALDAVLEDPGTPVAVRAVVEAHRLGRPLAAVIDDSRDVPERSSDPVPLRLTFAVLGTAALHGGTPAEAIDRTAATLRERAALQHEAHGHAAAAQLSARVLTAVPLAFAAFAMITDPRVRTVVIGTPLGWLCLVVGLCLNLAGRLWMTRIVASAEGWST